jgi:hypothetical protein
MGTRDPAAAQLREGDPAATQLGEDWIVAPVTQRQMDWAPAARELTGCCRLRAGAVGVREEQVGWMGVVREVRLSAVRSGRRRRPAPC